MATSQKRNLVVKIKVFNKSVIYGNNGRKNVGSTWSTFNGKINDFLVIRTQRFQVLAKGDQMIEVVLYCVFMQHCMYIRRSVTLNTYYIIKF